MATTLGTPLTDEAVRSINFFNGRLLTGGDLSREQDARRLADARLGAAVGPGIAWGLEVRRLEGAPPGRVQVMRGLGVGLSGQVLNLATDPVVQLVPPPPEPGAVIKNGAFGLCGPLSGAPYAAGDGLYLLTLAPTSKADGNAPVLALDAVNTRCSTDAFLEAAQLRLLLVNDPGGDFAIAASQGRLRNVLAYAFLGSKGQATAHRQPGQIAAPGLLQQMLDDNLSRCDVPLAVLQMVGSSITLVDRWAVRRRLASGAANDAYAAWLGETVCALGEAQFLQFQEHLIDEPTLANAAATQKLAWLPPAGFLPAGAPWQTFLGPRAPARLVDLASADTPDVLAGALRGDAVELGNTADSTKFRVYRVGGSTGPLLFVRDGRNVHHAEQVWLDDALTLLPGVADLQTAIDRLAAGSCLHMVMRPQLTDIASRLSKLPAGQDVTLCFEPGEYTHKVPLELKGLGRVHLRGAGARLLNTEGECALRIVECGSAVVSDIAVEGGSAGTGKDELGIGLYGALTIVDTPRVDVHQVAATCATAKGLGSVGIVATVRSGSVGKYPRAQVTLVGNLVKVGAGQQGLLCTNFDLTTIRGNRIGAADAAGSLQRGIVVGGSKAGSVHIDDNVVRDVVRGIAVGISESSEAGAPPLTAGRVVMARNRVELQLQGVTGGGRYGLFVGNAGSACLLGNHVVVAGGNATKLEVQAMRLAGVYGPQVIVRDNLFEDVFKGIAFQPDPKGRPLSFVWAFQCNVALRAASVVLEFPSDLNELVIDEHNTKVFESAPPPPSPLPV